MVLVLPCARPHHKEQQGSVSDWPTTCVAGRATAVAMEANSQADNSLCVTGAVEQGGRKKKKIGKRGKKKTLRCTQACARGLTRTCSLATAPYAGQRCAQQGLEDSGFFFPLSFEKGNEKKFYGTSWDLAKLSRYWSVMK